jgi:hypothetical protein
VTCQTKPDQAFEKTLFDGSIGSKHVVPNNRDWCPTQRYLTPTHGRKRLTPSSRLCSVSIIQAASRSRACTNLDLELGPGVEKESACELRERTNRAPTSAWGGLGCCRGLRAQVLSMLNEVPSAADTDRIPVWRIDRAFHAPAVRHHVSFWALSSTIGRCRAEGRLRCR